MQELLDFGFSIKNCEFVIQWLRKNVDNPFLIFHYCRGDKIYLLLDIKKKQVIPILQNSLFNEFYTDDETTKPKLLFPIHSIITEVFKKIEKDDLTIEIDTPLSGLNINGVVFYVGSDKVEFNVSDNDIMILPIKVFFDAQSLSQNEDKGTE